MLFFGNRAEQSSRYFLKSVSHFLISGACTGKRKESNKRAGS